MAEKAADNDKLLAVVSCIPLVGLIIYIAMPEASAYVKNYAKQSIIIFVLEFVLGLVPLVNCVAWIILLVGMIMLIIKALQEDRTYRLPVIADIADKIFK